MTPHRPRYHRGRIQWLFAQGSVDTRIGIGSVWKAWHFVVIHENVSLTLQLRRILTKSKSSMWKCLFRLFEYFQEVSWPIQLCLLAVDAATMCRVCFRSTSTVSLSGLWSVSLQSNRRKSNSMENIDNDFAHKINLWSDCNYSLHMPQSWVVLACAKIFSKVYPRWGLRNKTPSTFHQISITLGKCLVKLAQDTVKTHVLLAA